MKTLEFEKIQELKYGENPHQSASLYKTEEVVDYELLKGSFLSYNNILNATTALDIAAEFFDVACCTIVKNTVPVSVALGKELIDAYEKTLDSDPISHFNSTIVFTRELNEELAQKISEIPVELLIAPNFSKNSLEILEKNKNLKIVKINTPLNKIPSFVKEEIKITPFGALIQEKNTKDFDVNTFKILTKLKPEQKTLENMIFAFKVVKHTKSAGVVIAKDLRTLAVSSGEGNRIDGIEIAFSKICDSAKDSVVATDGAISTINNIQVMAQNRAIGLIQPAGTIKDSKLAEYSDKMNISMVATGIRHLKY